MSTSSINLHNVVKVEQYYTDYPDSDEDMVTSKIKATTEDGSTCTFILFGTNREDLKIQT